MPAGHVDRQMLFGFLARLTDAPKDVRASQAALSQLRFAEQALAILDRPDLPESFARPDDSRVAMVYTTTGSWDTPAVGLAHFADTSSPAGATSLQAAPTVDRREIVGSPTQADNQEATLSVPWPAAGYRFRVLRPHAKGGIGQVLVARDLELNRDVALKQIQGRFADDPHNRSRFVLEAEITGNLEHPGIVPIYGLGAYADGRPFYAMKFIRGQSFQDAIDKFHITCKPPLAALHCPAFDHNLEFRKLLGHFVAVCQTIAYAHSRGVLHRDIKPGNIMLGSYGETLVVDWGLAKTIDQSTTAWQESRIPQPQQDRSSEPSLRRSSTGSSHSTMQGSVVGTPGYLSPEQAAGRLEELGPASDVYSLGATLYRLLTGSTPLSKEPDLGAVLRKTLTGEIATPRQLNAAVPRALEAICLKAMALCSADRYPSPKELAADLESWLADEPIVAHREPFVVRAHRWLRNHPKSVAAFAATVFVGLTSLALIATVVSDKNEQLSTAYGRLEIKTQAETTARQEAQRAHQQEQEQRRQAEVRRVEAEVARRQEEQSRRQAEAAEMISNYLVDSFRNPDLRRNGRTLTVAEVLQAAVARLNNEFGDEPVVKSHLLEALGKSYQNLGLNDHAQSLFRSARQLQEVSLGNDDLKALSSIDANSLNRFSAGKIDQALPLLEESVERCQSAHGIDDERTMAAMNNLALGYLAAGRTSASIELLQQTLERRHAVLGASHPDTHCSMNNLARAYQNAGRIDEALPLFENLLCRRRESLPEEHPLIASSLNNLAAALSAAGQTERALPLHEEALEKTRAALGSDHATTHIAMNNLAKAHQTAGQLEKALPLWEEALIQQQKTLGDQHEDTLVSLHNLANAYRSAGRVREAVPLLERALGAMKARLGTEHADTIALRKELTDANRTVEHTEETKKDKPSEPGSPWKLPAWPSKN